MYKIGVSLRSRSLVSLIFSNLQCSATKPFKVTTVFLTEIEKGLGSETADLNKINIANSIPKSKMSELQEQERNFPRFSFLASHTLSLEGMISH